MENDVICRRLEELAEPDYRDFHSRLVPGKGNILGVRNPVLRGVAREIVRQGDPAYYLAQARDDSYEEVMLQGMVIGLMKGDIEVILDRVARFIPKIDNWAVCDTFAAGLKITRRHRERVWEFLMPCTQSENPWEVRFALVMLMDYYTDEDHLPALFAIYDGIGEKWDHYYVRMALAWAVSDAYIACPEETTAYLKADRLDDWTHNKAIQKIRESRRVTAAQKEGVRQLRR